MSTVFVIPMFAVAMSLGVVHLRRKRARPIGIKTPYDADKV